MKVRRNNQEIMLSPIGFGILKILIARVSQK